MKTVLMAAMAALVIFSACKTPKPVSSSTAATTSSPAGSEVLYQNEWKLTELPGQPVPIVSRAQLAFTPGTVNRVSGNAGCNRLTGSFELSSTNNIKFSPMAVTKMACAEPALNEVETKFLSALTNASQWSIENGTLSLTDGGVVLAKLIAQRPATADEKKLNGNWELNFLSGTKIALAGLFPNGKPNIVFAFPADEVKGNGGCNGYSAKVKVDKQKISFSDPLSTMMFCEGNGEPQYFKMLKTITSYALSNSENTLTLIAGDIAVMTFSRK